MLRGQFDRPRHGVMHYNVSIAAARLSESQCEKYSLVGVQRDRCNALDCQPECYDAACYGELASSDDGQSIPLSVKLSSKNAPFLLEDKSDTLRTFLRYADRQFSRRVLPRAYRKQRIREGRGSRRFGRAVSASLPVGILTAIAALLCYLFYLRDAELLPVSDIGAIAASVALGALSCILCALLRIHRRSRMLWRF
ncbi:MAG: hypothetical protein IJC18_04710 [Clostridia bacterium]|nr:hypothetical protein [Clostridia bacterium]